MRLGGWARLGIVTSTFYGILLVYFAYDGRPRLRDVQLAWFDEAANIIADRINEKEGTTITQQQVRERVLSNDDNAAAAWLEKVATSPSEQQTLFSSDIRKVNDKYRPSITNFTHRQQAYWFAVFAWWAGGTLLIFGIGCTVGWVYRGFQLNST
jgi:hypothetical protein